MSKREAGGERRPTRNCIKLFKHFIETCRYLGWPKEAMEYLADMWWKHHDDEGNFKWDGGPK